MYKKLFTVLIFLSFNAHAENVFKRGNSSEPKSIDPHIAEGATEANIMRDLFEGLVSENARGDLVSGLAESWVISPDGKNYTFKLRPSNVWSDGVPITAHDIVYSWQRAVNPETGSSYSFILYPIKNAKAISEGKIKELNELGVKALDDFTVQVELENPTPYFLGLLAHSVAAPVPRHLIEKFGKQWTKPENSASSGAFKLVEWKANSRLTLAKSDTYWDKDAVKLDKVIYFPIEDVDSELKRYRSGELDMMNNLSDEQIKWAKKNAADELNISPILGSYFYGINQTVTPFKDNVKLRQALSLAIDRQAIVEKVLGAGEQVSFSVVPNIIDGYQSYIPDYAKLTQKERNELAKKLYAESGFNNTKPLEVLYNTDANHKKVAIAIAAMWKQVLGIKVELRNEEWKVFLQNRINHKTKIFRSGWYADYNDPYTFLESYQSNAGLNDIGLANSDFDSLLNQAAQEADANKRFAMIQKAEKIMIDDAAIIPIATYVSKRLLKPYVKGFEGNALDTHRSKYISLEK